jgi:uncharacterized protein (TIGR00299 family) protein
MLAAKSIVLVDCRAAGISGDMILGALIDLGADLKKIEAATTCIQDYLRGCKSLKLNVSEVTRKGFRARRVDIEADDNVKARTGKELKEALANSIKALKLSDEATRLAENAMEILIKTEANLHGMSMDEVWLHEAGSVDTIVDIVGTVVGLEDLGLLRNAVFYSTPVAVGGGLLTFSHGTVSTPAPATLEILRSKAFPMIGGPAESELATPTGVALLVNMTHVTSNFYPPMKPLRIGYGAGSVDYPGVPNLLRIVIGESFDYALASDEIHVLETNLDDVSGEIIGHAIDRLLEEGAKDVSIIPIFTKKSRPGQIIKVISEGKDVHHLVRVLIEETGTLGVRDSPCKRHIVLREIRSVNISIDNKNVPVKVKIAKDLEGKIIQVKPEHDDVERMARETGRPYRMIAEMIIRKARSLIEDQI